MIHFLTCEVGTQESTFLDADDAVQILQDKMKTRDAYIQKLKLRLIVAKGKLDLMRRLHSETAQEYEVSSPSSVSNASILPETCSPHSGSSSVVQSDSAVSSKRGLSLNRL